MNTESCIMIENENDSSMVIRTKDRQSTNDTVNDSFTNCFSCLLDYRLTLLHTFLDFLDLLDHISIYL